MILTKGNEAFSMQPILQLENLSVSFDTPEGEIQAVRNVSLTLNPGEILAVVGESGCGKTVMGKAVMKLLPKNAGITGGRILADGRDITNCREKEMKKLRGGVLSMVFQDPMTSLNPTVPVGKQIMESVLKHESCARRQAKARALEMMELVGIRRPERMFALQPHCFSGGMRQRCVLAAALASRPKILFSDEATTALDATVQAKILNLLLDIRKKTGISIVFISHDLGVVSRVADRVAVMYAGRIAEIGTAEEVFYDPRHPYTWGLLSALPCFAGKTGTLNSIPGMPPVLLDPPPGDAFAERNACALAVDYEKEPPMVQVTPTHSAATWLLDSRAPKVERPEALRERASLRAGAARKKSGTVSSETVLNVVNLKRYFSIGGGETVKAVDGVSFSVRRGEVFGLVGETGCGKSTAARTILGVYPPTDGQVFFKGMELSRPDVFRRNRTEVRKNVQMIFQDSAAALNPHMTAEEIIAEPLKIHRMTGGKKELAETVGSLLAEVGLDDSCRKKVPSELSGGQRQRVAIARCLSMKPELVLADEPIASLDVSIQAQIINLFCKLQREHGFSFLFIAHDLSVVRYLCDRVAVMLQGKIVETAPAEELFRNPLHPYTQALLSAVPLPDPLYEREKEVLEYDGGSALPEGALAEVSQGHFVYRPFETEL